MREIEMSMSLEQIKEALKNYLYVHGPTFKTNEAIENISFNTTMLKGGKDSKIIPLTLKISEEEEVKILKF